MPTSSAFKTISEIATGVDNLDASIANAYEARISEAFPKSFDSFMKDAANIPAGPGAEATLSDLLKAGSPHLDVARQIIQIWYTSQFSRPDGSVDPPQSEDQFKSALLWRVIGAVAPAYSDRPYGYWKDKPAELA